MASEVGICNRALQLLGATRIAALTEDNVNARACNVAYEPVRDAELRKHPWRFAIKRVRLAASVTAPAFGRTTAFPLPSDCLRVIPTDPEQQVATLDWQIENGNILTDDTAPLNIRYVAKITDPNVFDPLFRESLSAALAVSLCEELTNSNLKLEAAKDTYEKIMLEARRANAFERTAAVSPDSDWFTIRG